MAVMILPMSSVGDTSSSGFLPARDITPTVFSGLEFIFAFIVIFAASESASRRDGCWGEAKRASFRREQFVGFGNSKITERKKTYDVVGVSHELALRDIIVFSCVKEYMSV
jgi:hypothetical protein